MTAQTTRPAPTSTVPESYLREVAEQISEIQSLSTSDRETKILITVGFLKAIFYVGEASGLREGQNIYDRITRQ